MEGARRADCWKDGGGGVEGARGADCWKDGGGGVEGASGDGGGDGGGGVEGARAAGWGVSKPKSWYLLLHGDKRYSGCL